MNGGNQEATARQAAQARACRTVQIRVIGVLGVLLVGLWATRPVAQVTVQRGYQVAPAFLCLGDCTSSFAALRANGTTLEARIGTNAAYTQMNATSFSAESAGYIQPALDGAAGNAGADYVRLYIREDISTTGTAAADCNLVARLNSGTEVTVVTLVTDGGCP